MKEFARVTSPLGAAEPEELAGLIAYIASDDARYMVGSIVSMDGGITA
jgi:meso-butanediol dehydrogenase/(S,S)-butanediol dehydrogenase/diacetyl reductase